MFSSSISKILIQSVFYTVILLTLYMIGNQFVSGEVWSGMKLSNSAVLGEYCEKNHGESFFHQKMNTYSNLFYSFFGFVVCLLAIADSKASNAVNRTVSFPALSFLYGVCFIYLGFGSSFFHASLTWIGQRVDMNGTYGLSIALMAIAVWNVFHKTNLSSKQRQIVIFLLVLLILAFYQIHLMVSSSFLVPAMILTLWVLMIVNYFQFRSLKSSLLAISSILLIIVAIKIRQMDVEKINCNPDSLIQGHAIWHLLTGLSSFLGYLFFRINK